METYSLLQLAKHALSGHKHWPQAWRSPAPKPHYDVVIIGGGGHGLAMAYYLAKKHGISNVAVLEKGWLGAATQVAIPPWCAPIISTLKALAFLTTR